jgi:mono/diheme cytochrome c family protein
MPRVFALCAIVLLAAACNGNGDDPPASPRGVDTAGAELFAERVIGANPGCVTCHSLEPGVTLVGPSLAEVVSPVPDQTAAEYVRQSILEPDAYVGEGFVAGQMPGGWEDLLSAEQIESLVTLLSG